jgi:DNA repair exonuclease SbcCD ATPase subunit
MIPQRLYLKGFMSYRDEVVLDFAGSPLWMLTGPNGAGKSAAFDAITFALYGIHRLGKQKTKELIHHQADGLIVEFDFRVADSTYRVKRTVPRTGRPTFQAFCLDDAGRLRPISQTDTSDNLEDWVHRTLGINAESFITAVTLRQGKSDALLEAKPTAKNELLSQLVDLSAYKRLYERAEERHKKHKQSAGHYQQQLQALEPVNEDEVAAIESKISQSETENKRLQARQVELAELKVRAEQWGKLTQDQNEIEQAIDEARELLDQAEQIEREAHRLAELQQVLPTITHISDERQRLVTNEKAIIEGEPAIERCKHDLQQANDNLEAVKKRFQELQDERDVTQRHYNDAQQTLLYLREHIINLDKIEQLRRDLREQDRQLERFPQDLDVQIREQRHRIEELKALQQALPWLKQFAETRSNWNDSHTRLNSLKHEIEKLTKMLQELHAKHDDRERAQLEADNQVKQTQQGVTRAQTQLEEVSHNVARFEDVAELPECSYCGQPLTEEHLADERRRLQEKLSSAEQLFQQASHEHKQATMHTDEIGAQLEELNKEVAELKQQTNQAETTRELAEQALKRAEQQADQALRELPVSYRDRVLRDTAIGVSECFAGEYPSPAELEDMEQRVGNIMNLQHALDTLEKQLHDRDQNLAVREREQARFDELTEQYSEQNAHEIRERERQARETRDTNQHCLENLSEELQCKRSALGRAEQEKNEAEQMHQEAQAKITQAKTRQQEIERTIESQVRNLPTEWQESVRAATSAEVYNWQIEAKNLTGADKHFEQLKEARRDQDTRKQRATQIAQELQGIPEDARRPSGEIDQCLAEIRNEHAVIQQRLEEEKKQKQELVSRRERRRELDMSYQREARAEHLHKELARLLGKENLQSHLLEQAERGIVAYANEILDRISSGSLHLELQRSDNGQSADNAKAFDIVAINRDTGDRKMSVGLLSGGQRFRVAVSLALGIGKYASQDNQSIESVIIDEGFGSLDKQGRREMIDQLHRLGDTLCRIILVSHQEEFANEFPNRYAVELVDGTSRVSLAN